MGWLIAYIFASWIIHSNLLDDDDNQRSINEDLSKHDDEKESHGPTQDELETKKPAPKTRIQEIKDSGGWPTLIYWTTFVITLPPFIPFYLLEKFFKWLTLENVIGLLLYCFAGYVVVLILASLQKYAFG